MRINIRVAIIFCISLNFISIGCALTPPVNYDNMVPRLDYSLYSPTGKLLSLEGVEGSQDLPEKKNLQVSPQAFQHALVKALQKSSIFEKVSTNPEGDYLLKVKIISQKVLYGVTTNSLLFVRYTLIDKKDGNMVWEEKILSQHDTFGGELTYAVETTVRENIASFIQKLSAFTSKEIKPIKK